MGCYIDLEDGHRVHGEEDWGLSLSLKPPNTSLPDLQEVEMPKLSSPSPNSTLTSTTTSCKRHFRSFDHSDDRQGGGKKLRLSKEQITVLEQAFKEHSTLNTKQKSGLAKQVNLSPRQVEVWFQNRRARTKLKQTEVEFDYLKRFCESLKEENKKLQREVQCLRGYKLLSANRHRACMLPTNTHAATLTMCPSRNSVAKETPINVFHGGPRLNTKKLSPSAITTTQYSEN